MKIQENATIRIPIKKTALEKVKSSIAQWPQWKIDLSEQLHGVKFNLDEVTVEENHFFEFSQDSVDSGRKILDEITQLLNTVSKDGFRPTKLNMGIEQYKSVWAYTYYNWTRDLSKPHTLEYLCGCEIEVTPDDNTIKFI